MLYPIFNTISFTFFYISYITKPSSLRRNYIHVRWKKKLFTLVRFPSKCTTNFKLNLNKMQNNFHLYPLLLCDCYRLSAPRKTVIKRTSKSSNGGKRCRKHDGNIGLYVCFVHEFMERYSPLRFGCLRDKQFMRHVRHHLFTKSLSIAHHLYIKFSTSGKYKKKKIQCSLNCFEFSLCVFLTCKLKMCIRTAGWKCTYRTVKNFHR